MACQFVARFRGSGCHTLPPGLLPLRLDGSLGSRNRHLLPPLAPTRQRREGRACLPPQNTLVAAHRPGLIIGAGASTVAPSIRSGTLP
jgi:hypothetical protein